MKRKIETVKPEGGGEMGKLDVWGLLGCKLQSWVCGVCVCVASELGDSNRYDLDWQSEPAKRATWGSFGRLRSEHRPNQESMLHLDLY